jgi:HEAT repeat protein
VRALPARGGRRADPAGRGRRAPGAPGTARDFAAQLRAARRMHSEERVSTLAGMLAEVMDRYHYKELAFEVIEELGRTNDPRAVEALGFALNNCYNTETRAEMVRVLASLRTEGSIRPLGRVAQDPEVDGELRALAVRAISRNLGEKVWLTLARVLARAIEQGNKELQGCVIEALRGANGRAVPVLLRALESEEEEERVSAATALGVTGDRTVIDSLRTAAFTSADEAFREAAAKAAILLYCT